MVATDMERFTVLSEHPSIVIVDPMLIGPRLDASNYRQDYLLNRSRIRDLPFGSRKLSSLLVKPSFRGKGFSDNTSGKTPVIKVRNVTHYGIRGPYDYTDGDKISTNDRAWAHKGDVLLTVTGLGSSGKADLFESDFRMLLDGHIAILRCTSDCDNGFLKAFLSSSFGQRLSDQDTIGSTGQIELYGEYIDKFDIPYPDPKIQAYIGDKVRLAEKCREMAQTKRSQIEYLLDQHAQKADIAALLSAKPRPSHNIEAKILNNRLDAEFYQPHYLDLVQMIQARPYQKLGDVIQLPIKGVQPEYDSKGTVPALTGTDIDPYRLDLEGASRVNMEWATGKTKALAVSNEILFTVTGPPLGEAAVVHSFQAPLVINSHVARIKPQQSFPYPFYLAALMNSIIVSAQVYRYCKGVRQKELYPEDILLFVIPEIDIEIVRQINNLGYAADFLEYRASGLIREAIADVENLIEGKLQTSEIVESKLIAPIWENIERQLQNSHA